MASIRVRLTVAYAAALVATMAAFGGALWLGRRESVLRDQQPFVFAQADLAQRVLRRAATDSQPIALVADPLVGPMLNPELATLLDVFPGYLLVLDSTGRMLYASPAARLLAPDDLDLMVDAARRLEARRLAARVELDSDVLLVAGRLETDPRLAPVERVVAGAGTNRMREQAERELLGSMLVIAPVLVVLSVGGAYV
ncbi:MAG TPA: hypothetical protein VFY16_09785, partial [Gemmatimonadaceae bacterium]|nr:hypothetical protein [Gemmatimonadaceae bacterium]